MTGLTLGLLAVVWGAEGGEEEEKSRRKRSKGSRGKERREGNKQRGLVIWGKVHIKLEITDKENKMDGWNFMTLEQQNFTDKNNKNNNEFIIM